MVSEHDSTGRAVRIDTHLTEQLPAALERLRELASVPAGTAGVDTLATRSLAQLQRAWAARDWPAIEALHAAGFRISDRRHLMRLELEREAALRSLALVFRADEARLGSRFAQNRLLATRGERLVLQAASVEATYEGGGPIVGEFLLLVEVDADGQRTTALYFDRDDEPAAYAELDARFEAGEGAQHPAMLRTLRAFRRGFDTRDFEAIGALLQPDLVVNDHRPLGWETLRGARTYLDSLRALVALADDVRLDVDHVELCDRGLLWAGRWTGTREGGAFETTWITVSEHDPTERCARIDTYSAEQLAEARARFEELRGDRDFLQIPPNSAVRASLQYEQILAARDWAALERLCAPELCFEDRRRGVLTTGDRAMFLASSRLIGQAGARATRTLLATSGERLALQHLCWRGESDGASFEVVALSLTQVDAEGRIALEIAFDPDDRRAASLELFERSDLAREPRGAGMRAMLHHDLARLREILPPDSVYWDRRKSGAGRLDRDEHLAWLAALFEQSPDAVIETAHSIATGDGCRLGVGHTFGTLAGGGSFENVYLVVGAPKRIELFDLDDLAGAQARFEELRREQAAAARDPLQIPPNAATRAVDRLVESIAARDWDAVEALHAERFEFEDRRAGLRDRGDRKKLLHSMRLSMASGASAVSELLATAGDRLALQRLLFRVHDGDTLVAEIDTLHVFEVDAEGRFVASIAFDAQDRRGAMAEMTERFFASEPRVPRASRDIWRAYHARDLAALRAAIPAGFRLHDHRRTGVGDIEGAEAYLASVGALFEQTHDLALEFLYHAGVSEPAVLSVTRMSGTLREGGAFESLFVSLFYLDARGRAVTETYELEDLPRAQERFAELCAAKG
jgi:hypothetical protein